MGWKENVIIKERLSNLQKNERLFRINAGMGWAGEIVKIDKTKKIIILRNPAPLHAAPQGWPDLAGFTSIEITPDMVGQHIAIFTAEEIKINSKIKKNSYQDKFRNVVLKFGGIFREIKK